MWSSEMLWRPGSFLWIQLGHAMAVVQFQETSPELTYTASWNLRLFVTFILWYPFEQIPGKSAIQWVLHFYISDALIPRAAANHLSSSELLFCLTCLTLAFWGCLVQVSWRESLPWEQTWSCGLMIHLIPVGRVNFFSTKQSTWFPKLNTVLWTTSDKFFVSGYLYPI